MKRPIIRRIRNIALSVVILLVITVGAGIGYTWYMGRNTVVQVPSYQVTESVSEIKHIKPAANVPQSASIQSLSSPVIPGQNALVIAKTKPDSTCVISVIYDKTASIDSGLKQKTADEFGMVSWSWTVDAAAPFGKWPVKITCTHNKLSAVVIGDLIVATKTD